MASPKGRRKAVGVVVTGVPEIDRRLRKLPGRLAAKVVRRAMDKEARATAKAVKSNTPVLSGTTKRNVKATRTKSTRRGNLSARVLVNWKGVAYFRDGFYPAFVEYGAPSRNVEAERYMEEVYDSRAVPARDEIMREIKSGIDSEVKKLSGERL